MHRAVIFEENIYTCSLSLFDDSLLGSCGMCYIFRVVMNLHHMFGYCVVMWTLRRFLRSIYVYVAW